MRTPIASVVLFAGQTTVTRRGDSDSAREMTVARTREGIGDDNVSMELSEDYYVDIEKKQSFQKLNTAFSKFYREGKRKNLL